ncbi:MAG TPA: DnaJ C-terminal domain-containing protein, partial [Methanomicrobiales archaeon]|nr:DnaJ C-terminal domain-containing protein [Methanomicrobiales archaeon]
SGSGTEGTRASTGFVEPGSAPCRECGGRRRIPETPCAACGGWGATQAVRRVTVRIPPGIDTGMRIRKEGLGREGDLEIPSGDLYVEVVVRPHERFARRGYDLEIPVHVSPARAALGSATELPTIDGRTVRVGIPAGVQHEAAVRVTGEGVKTRERCGDLVARIQIDTPSHVTGEEQALYRQILRIEERREEAKKAGILSRALSRMRDAGR